MTSVHVDRLISGLKHSFNQKAFPQALLFFGPQNENVKLDILFPLAQHILGMKRELSSEQFRELGFNAKIPDLICISPDEKHTIKLEEIEKIQSITMLTPFESQNRVIIISESDTMTLSSQNALLKQLEEPPERNYYFLTTFRQTSLLPTILSRTTKYPILLEAGEKVSSRDYFPTVHTETIDAERISEITQKIAAIVSHGTTRKSVLFKLREITVEMQQQQELRYALSEIAYQIREKLPETAKDITELLMNDQTISCDSAASVLRVKTEQKRGKNGRQQTIS